MIREDALFVLVLTPRKAAGTLLSILSRRIRNNRDNKIKKLAWRNHQPCR
jgi:hypothetical protein